MRVFVTGATGYIGSAVVRKLIGAGHQVVGLTRSDNGAEAHRGTLDDLDSLHSGTAEASGVIHLAFQHGFSDFAAALTTDLRAVETMGAALEGTGKPFVTTAHLNGEASDNAVLALAGVRSSVASLSVRARRGRQAWLHAKIDHHRSREGRLCLYQRRVQPLASRPSPRCGVPVLPGTGKRPGEVTA